MKCFPTILGMIQAHIARAHKSDVSIYKKSMTGFGPPYICPRC